MSEEIEANYKRKLSGLRLDLALGKIDSGTAKSMMQIYKNERDAQLNGLEEHRVIEETALEEKQEISEMFEVLAEKMDAVPELRQVRELRELRIKCDKLLKENREIWDKNWDLQHAQDVRTKTVEEIVLDDFWEIVKSCIEDLGKDHPKLVKKYFGKLLEFEKKEAWEVT